MKQFVLAAAVALFATSVSAQAFRKYKISFRTNPNIGWMVPQNNNLETLGSSLSFGFGVSTDILFTENYAIGTGLNFERMGGKLNYFAEVTESDGTRTPPLHVVDRERVFSLRYIEIPLTLKLRTNEIGYVTYWGQFGFGLGVNWRAMASDVDDYRHSNLDGVVSDWGPALDESSTYPSVTTENIDIQDEVKLFRTSLIVGGGVEYSLSGTTSLVLGVTVNNGFINVFNKNAEGIERNADDEVVEDPDGLKTFELKATNNTIGLTIGLLF
ncbi:MAG: porin family protein [Flavobacteriales bacterium]